MHLQQFTFFLFVAKYVLARQRRVCTRGEEATKLTDPAQTTHRSPRERRTSLYTVIQEQSLLSPSVNPLYFATKNVENQDQIRNDEYFEYPNERSL